MNYANKYERIRKLILRISLIIFIIALMSSTFCTNSKSSSLGDALLI